jgi:hypothetical protein
MINFAYLNSLDWTSVEDNNGISYEAENKEYYFFLYKFPIKVEGFFNKRIYYKIFLVVTDIKTNTMITSDKEKLTDLWNNLVKETISIKEKMEKEIEL